MTKKKFFLAAVAATMCASTAAAGIAGISAESARMNNFTKSAHAASAVIRSDEAPSIGLDKTVNGIQFSKQTPAELTLSGVAEGQYTLEVQVTANDSEQTFWFVDVQAQVDDGDIVPLGSNGIVNRGIIYVPAGATKLTLYTNTVIYHYDEQGMVESETNVVFTADATITDISIGAGNAYSLSGLTLFPDEKKSEIAFKDFAAGNYKLTLNIDSGELEEDSFIYVAVDGRSTEMTYVHEDWYEGYEATVTVPENAKTLSLYTDNTTAIKVSFYFEEVIVYSDLPTTSFNTTMWETNVYKFTVEADGYYTFAATSSDPKASFAIQIMEDPEAYEGIEVPNGQFPVLLTAGEHYIAVTYLGYEEYVEGEEAPETVDCKITIGNWTAPSLDVNGRVIYLPLEANKPYTIDLTPADKTGYFTLAIVGVTYEFGMMGGEVTVKIGTNTYTLNAEDNYAATFKLDGSETEVTFTSNMTATLGFGISVSEYELKLGVPENTTIAGYSSAIYYLENLKAGTYTLTIQVPEGANLEVYRDYTEEATPVIPAGSSSYTFTVEADMEGRTSFYFRNLAETAVTFTINAQAVVA